MIKFENAVREIQFGRYEQKLETQFVLGTMPGWLTTTGTPSYENNGLTLPSSTEYTTLDTAAFALEQMTMASLELFNVNFKSDTADAYIALVKSDNTAAFCLLSGGATAGCSLAYRTGSAAGVETTGTAVFTDSNVGKIGTITKFRFMKDSDGVARYGSAPRNLRFAVFPVEKELVILENGVPSYTLNTYIHPTGADMSAVSFAGNWKFRVGFKTGLHLAGAELKIQQNL